jgi:hypothetical protein
MEIPVRAPLVRPTNRTFSEQSQKALRISLSLRSRVIVGFVISAILLISGILCTLAYNSSHEYEQRYDHICPVGNEEECIVSFSIPEELSGRISFSYKLTQFHQNHRRFVYSRSASQLQGVYVPYSDLSACKPYRSVDDSPEPENWILPSGAFAHFIFNDTIYWDNETQLAWDEWAITFKTEWGWTYMPLSEEYTTGIKWMRNNTVFPLSFEYPEQDPHYIRWMRTDASQTVVKEIAICEDCTIPAGEYEIRVISRYPTSIYGGEKWIVITETMSIGDRSRYLGVVQLVTSGVMFLFTVFLIVVRFAFPTEQHPAPLTTPLLPDLSYSRMRSH